ncbi:MAG TPA: hypothetical protein VII73_05700 [Caulobacteraceae bacterium]
MSGVTARPLNPAFWLGAPISACVFATLIFALPLRLFGLQLPEPVFALVPAFAWAMIRPSILPPFALLGLGVFLDILWGGPIGLWPICLLSTYAPALAARRFLAGQGYGVLWVAYGAACAAALGVGVVVTMARTGAPPGLIGVLWQYLVTAAMFPFAHRLIERYEDADVRFR